MRTGSQGGDVGGSNSIVRGFELVRLWGAHRHPFDFLQAGGDGRGILVYSFYPITFQLSVDS